MVERALDFVEESLRRELRMERLQCSLLEPTSLAPYYRIALAVRTFRFVLLITGRYLKGHVEASTVFLERLACVDYRPPKDAFRLVVSKTEQILHLGGNILPS
jgi:hypothetical protein